MGTILGCTTRKLPDEINEMNFLAAIRPSDPGGNGLRDHLVAQTANWLRRRCADDAGWSRGQAAKMSVGAIMNPAAPTASAS